MVDKHSDSFNRHVQDDVHPEDSASNISNPDDRPTHLEYRGAGIGDDAPWGTELPLDLFKLPSRKKSSSSSSLVTASLKSSKLLQTPKARALELATKLEMVKLHNECERKQRLLQQQIEEEEEEENLRKAQHEVLVKRRQRALVEEQERLKQRELELEVEMKYKFVKSVAEMNSDIEEPSIIQSNIKAKSESGIYQSQDTGQLKRHINVTAPSTSGSALLQEMDPRHGRSTSKFKVDGISTYMDTVQNVNQLGHEEQIMHKTVAMDNQNICGPSTVPGGTPYQNQELSNQNNSVRAECTSSYSTCTPTYSQRNSERVPMMEPRTEETKASAQQNAYYTHSYTQPGNKYECGARYSKISHDVELPAPVLHNYTYRPNREQQMKFANGTQITVENTRSYNDGRYDDGYKTETGFTRVVKDEYTQGPMFHAGHTSKQSEVGKHVGLHANTIPPAYTPSHMMMTPNQFGNQTEANVVQILMQHHLKASLPKRSIKAFGGDPLDYASFMRSFEQTIEARVDDEKERLYYLEQYTTGDPNKLVKSCMHIQQDPFTKAKALLTKKYGDSYKITSAFINKTARWENIKPDDAVELNRFSLFLIECKHVLHDLNQSHELDHSTNIKTVISKLPYRLRGKWRNKADYLMENGDIIKFSHIVDFVEVQARIASNPIYGDLSTDRKENESRRKWAGKPKKTIRSLATSTNTETAQKQKENDKLCLHCKGTNHNMDRCFKLERMNLQEKLNCLKTLGVCFGCLKKAKHLKRDCNNKLDCRKCHKSHPTILHQDRLEKQGDAPSTTQENKVSEQVKERTTCRRTHTGAGDSSGPTPSPCIVPVKIKSNTNGTVIDTLAYLDSGSDAVFCTDELRQQLGIKGKKTSLQVKTLTDERSITTHILKGLEICSQDGNHCIPLPEVYTQECIPADKEDLVNQDSLKKWPYLDKVQLNEVKCDATIGILIGSNIHEVFEPWEVVNSQNGGPYACRSILGWTVHGANTILSRSKHVTSARISLGKQASNLDSQLVQMYNHDFSEQLAEDVPENSQEDKNFMRFVEQSIQHKNGHYEIGLPVKSSIQEDIGLHDDIPNNKLQAEQRAQHLRRKFQRDKGFHEDYSLFMKETINNGYATIVPSEELEDNEGRRWYLPHHGVRHPKKDKLRVVFDCSVKYKGFCLNNKLLQGPNMTNTLIGVLLRFRQSSVAVVADIQAMFHQVKVPKQDQDLLRFLWWRDGDIERPLEEFRMTVHLFGATSSPACASFALKKAIEKSTKDAESTATMQRSFYVDDCLASVDTEEEAMTLVENLRETCQQGGFRLTKWLSNNRNVLYSIPPEERAADVRSLDLEDNSLPTERTLGVLWSSESDAFGYQISLPNKPNTRRGILSVVSSIYDPLGFVAPVVLPAKIILQNLCSAKLGWDQPIPCDNLIRWQRWLKEIPNLTDFQVARCVKPLHCVKFQLHHFADASDVGYGTVTYLRTVTEDDKVHCSLIMSKARVAPLKKISIPRMELTAATVAVKVNRMLLKEFDIGLPIESFFWTDSMTVLRYINNRSTRFHTFVANRVAVIQDGSEPSQWRYVSTTSNPADDCSRGLSVKNFLSSTRWIEGPAFLKDAECDWPTNEISQNNDMEISEDPEVRRSTIVATVHTTDPDSPLNKLMEYFPSFYRLKVAVGWILRIKQRLLQKARQRAAQHQAAQHDTQQPGNMSEASSTKLQVTDLQAAETAIIQYVQRKAFPQEMKTLMSVGIEKALSNRNRPTVKYVKKSSPICKLDPFMDMEDGVIKVGGRLSRSSLPEETKHPSILPRNSHVSELILHEAHEATGHSGRNHMIAHVQRKYWITSVNSQARKIIGKCVSCRRQRAKVCEQKMSDLPESRITPEEPPFTRVGVDYFGPLEVKRGRCIVKRYGVVFTCFSTRAIHIEKADTLETDSCISAIRRFIARRGQVKEIHSDNGSNLVGAERELRQHIDKWNQSRIHQDLLQENIDWFFNPPAASHMGGIWERQIRTIRKLMCSILKEQTLSDESLATLFCEVESVINSRPITRVPGDAGDLEALTPNHLLLMKSKPVLPPVISEETGPYAKRRWKQVQYLAEIFWKRWLKEYLPMLQERQKWVRPKTNLQLGDIVLIVDSSKPRNTWSLGRVVKTMPDKNGLIRQVEVKTKSSILKRPVHKLCLVLEADE